MESLKNYDIVTNHEVWVVNLLPPLLLTALELEEVKFVSDAQSYIGRDQLVLDGGRRI